MLSLTKVSAFKNDIGDVADKFYATLPKDACNNCHGLHGGQDSNRGRLITSQPPISLGYCASLITSCHHFISQTGSSTRDPKLRITVKVPDDAPGRQNGL